MLGTKNHLMVWCVVRYCRGKPSAPSFKITKSARRYLGGSSYLFIFLFVKRNNKDLGPKRVPRRPGTQLGDFGLGEGVSHCMALRLLSRPLFRTVPSSNMRELLFSSIMFLLLTYQKTTLFRFLSHQNDIIGGIESLKQKDHSGFLNYLIYPNSHSQFNIAIRICSFIVGYKSLLIVACFLLGFAKTKTGKEGD